MPGIDGQRLFDYLIDHSITQKELSNRSGVDESTISQICNDKRNPGAQVLKNICKALDISADFLLDLSPSPKRNAEINDLGINAEAYEGLNVLYGKRLSNSRIVYDPPLLQNAANSLLSVLQSAARLNSYENAPAGELFINNLFDYLFQIAQYSDKPEILNENREEMRDYKTARSEVHLSFTQKILPNFEEYVLKHYAVLHYNFGKFIGYTPDIKQTPKQFYEVCHFRHNENSSVSFTKEQLDIAEAQYNELVETGTINGDPVYIPSFKISEESIIPIKVDVGAVEDEQMRRDCFWVYYKSKIKKGEGINAEETE